MECSGTGQGNAKIVVTRKKAGQIYRGRRVVGIVDKRQVGFPGQESRAEHRQVRVQESGVELRQAGCRLRRRSDKGRLKNRALNTVGDEQEMQCSWWVNENRSEQSRAETGEAN